MMRWLYVTAGLVALIGGANGAERYGDGRTHLYGPNGVYLGQCLDRQNGIRDCYDPNGRYTGRTRETDQGDKIVIERFGKNLGKPTSREVLRK